jgi:7,8-dihydropterin-6-yl-methyl-4-(beta-D-ribofuranosyl)aminobenzene 5'-phosphate synthase
MDERYLAVHVREKGFLVFSACSHAGIVNVLLDARDAFPDVPLYGVLGELHLSGAAMEQRIAGTVAELKAFQLRQRMQRTAPDGARCMRC